MNVESFSKLLQFSISPIAFISGASLLLLSITNRLGRTIDRSRGLVRELDSGVGAPFQEEHKRQLKILLRRSSYLRWAVLFTSVSIFLSCGMIIGMFFFVFLGWPDQNVVLACLLSSALSLSVAVVTFFLDVSLGLKALHIELARHVELK